jgi:acetyltransferase-like isoleucine patch superfamily enzyme
MTESSPRKDYQYETAVSSIRGKGMSGAFRNYMHLAAGTDSFLDLVRYEILTGCLGALPGGVGYLLRQKLYPYMMGRMGRGATIGRNVTIRGPRKIFIGRNVLIEDNCSIDARTAHSRIFIGDNVIVARGTIIRSRNGDIRVGEGTSIGSNCIIATDTGLTIGRDVLIAAYCYLSGGGSHNYDDLTIPIIKQGVTQKGGIFVEDGAWIGAQTVVLDGARICEGAIVGTKSMVNKELPKNSISFGIPAKVVRMRVEQAAT